MQQIASGFKFAEVTSMHALDHQPGEAATCRIRVRTPEMRGRSRYSDMLSVDTPTPFRVSDLLRFISEAMGRLDKPATSMPYLRLNSRLESLGPPLHSAYVAKTEAATAWVKAAEFFRS